MADQTKSVARRVQETAPSTDQAVRFLFAGTAGIALLVLSGLTLTGTVVALAAATPLLVIFSPVLVPAAIAAFLIAGGLLSAGGFGVAALSAIAWIYNYVTGKHPPGADKVDYARSRIMDTARDVKERAREYGHYVQHKAQEVTQG
ncbi:Oleosin [Nymphaea thermarum]|nr:Oleosin [Nymphaea thermarum]